MEERSVAVEVTPERHEDIPQVKDKFPALREEVAVRGGVALQSEEAGRYGARFCIAADEPSEAVEEGVGALNQAAAAAGVPEGAVADVEAPTLGELREQAKRAHELPDLIDLSGLSEFLAVNRHLAPMIARSKGFPAPIAELNGGPVWVRESVEDYLRSAEPQPGDGDEGGQEVDADEGGQEVDGSVSESESGRG